MDFENEGAKELKLILNETDIKPCFNNKQQLYEINRIFSYIKNILKKKL